ncbi:MAG TPA: hypothetical protein VFQ65_34475, partial [Kofleriaceae bacterium]|nr:hypothetical protein [Kofleriaceae bacterium]
ALRWIAAHHPDVVIADVQVPALDGRTLVRDLALAGAHHVVLLCPRRGHALDRPGVTCLTKPIAFTELHRCLRPAHAMKKRAS